MLVLRHVVAMSVYQSSHATSAFRRPPRALSLAIVEKHRDLS
jgi:hypothetical protein